MNRGRADEDLVIGAQRGGYALLLSGAQEALLCHGSRQIAGEGLAGVGLETQSQQWLTGSEQADHDVLAGMSQTVGHGPVHLLEDHPIGPGDPFVGQTVFQTVGPPAQQKEALGPLRVRGGKIRYFASEGFDDVHIGPRFSERAAPRRGASPGQYGTWKGRGRGSVIIGP